MQMIRCEGLVKIYKTDDVEVVALHGLNLAVEQGEMMAIIGNSGSGKSTLLNILGGLDRPSAGRANVGPWNLLKMTKEQLIRYKRETVGFIWQNNARNLVPYLTALQNVELPMLIQGKADRSYAKQLLETVGLGPRMGNRLTQLSGGEQQRVAIAIALANRPQLILADEPTGSVDSATGERIFDIFRRLNREMGVTIVIVTHDLSVADQVDRVVAIRDGLTSTEWIKREAEAAAARSAGGEGDGDAVSGRAVGGRFGSRHEEYVVIDHVGRLQIPKTYLESMNVGGKAVLSFDGKRVTIGPPEEAGVEAAGGDETTEIAAVGAGGAVVRGAVVDATVGAGDVAEDSTVEDSERETVTVSEGGERSDASNGGGSRG